MKRERLFFAGSDAKYERDVLPGRAVPEVKPVAILAGIWQNVMTILP